MDRLSVGLVEVWTVLSADNRGCGYLVDRRPIITYERHAFHKETKGRFSSPENQEISSVRVGEPVGGPREYDRLARALRLDARAALRSTSWGLGQVMGLHAEALGYGPVESFVSRMMESEDQQLGALTSFILHKRLDGALRTHDWVRFARGYNGPAYAVNQYDRRLAEAYAELSSGQMPDLLVREGQVRLKQLGFDVGTPDGYFSARTRSALNRFQQQQGLPLTSDFDELALQALREKGRLRQAA
jgi:hypothetical protein